MSNIFFNKARTTCNEPPAIFKSAYFARIHSGQNKAQQWHAKLQNILPNAAENSVF